MLGLIREYIPMFVSEGSINAEGIRLALEVEDIPKYKWSNIILKIVSYITAALEIQQEKK